jgi:hypothetical protein
LKRFDLVSYYELAEALSRAADTVNRDQNKGFNLYFNISDLPGRLDALVADDNGLHASKHLAKDLAIAIRHFIFEQFMLDGKFNPERFDADFDAWQYSGIKNKIMALRTVFLAECRDIEVYSVSQISIYKTSQLVSSASARISAELRRRVPSEALDEFDEAGKCLAFDLPTACGFHALRGLELMMGFYLRTFKADANPKSWFDYIKVFEKLNAAADADNRPSAKVVAMLDRMRVLDRNPLMHPQDRLDTAGADMLFNLAAITVSEMARDLAARDPQEELQLEVPALAIPEAAE